MVGSLALPLHARSEKTGGGNSCHVSSVLRGASGEELPVLSMLYDQVVRCDGRLLVPFAKPVTFPDIASKKCEMEGCMMFQEIHC